MKFQQRHLYNAKEEKSTKHMGPKPQYTRKEIKGPRIIAAKYNTSCVKRDQYPEGDTVEVAFRTLKWANPH